MSLALQNILRNAFYYTHLGTITIENCETEDRLGVTVSDTGKGISEKFQKKMFGRYTRDEDEITRNREGLGLGLYLTRQIVLFHDGEIEVDSEEGRGTKITLWIAK